MSASANKKLMQDIFAAAASPDPAARDRALFTESLADDAKWIVTGQYSWSRTFSGKQAILNDLHAYVRTRLVDRTRTVAHRFIADGDLVVVEAKGDNVTPEGVRYDNDYCLVFRLEEGKIKEIREYCNSVLTEKALGPFPQAAVEGRELSAGRRSGATSWRKPRSWRDDSGRCGARRAPVPVSPGRRNLWNPPAFLRCRGNRAPALRAFGNCMLAGVLDVSTPVGRSFPGLRERLRDATAAAHRELDAQLSSFDLTDFSGYRRFLQASAGALLPLEAALIDAGVAEMFPDWPERARSAAIADDLGRLGGAAQSTVTVPPPDAQRRAGHDVRAGGLPARCEVSVEDGRGRRRFAHQRSHRLSQSWRRQAALAEFSGEARKRRDLQRGRGDRCGAHRLRRVRAGGGPGMNEAVNLTNCDREPIHIPGSVQPFGFLLTLLSDFTICMASDNVGSFLGADVSDLLQQPLSRVISEAAVEAIRSRVDHLSGPDATERMFGVELQAGKPSYDLSIHFSGAYLVIEAEPSVNEPGVNSGELVRLMLERIRKTRGMTELAREAARQLKVLTGFDRVMVYQFHPDGSGEVIAEAAEAGLERFLGLHYPASDIPKQARILYQRNWLRIIADIDAQPAALVSTATHNAGLLDLSMSVLRSVSPIHIEYLRNMGVGASMSVSILRDGKLWGLFACHHYSPRHISFEKRTGVRAVRADVLLDRGGTRARGRRRLRGARPPGAGAADRDRGLPRAQPARDRRFPRRLSQHDRLRRHRGVVRRQDHAPGRDADRGRGEGARRASSTGRRRDGSSPAPRSPRSMPRASPSATAPPAFSPSRSRATPRDCLIFFRREVARSVNWAGDPNKVYDEGPNGPRLTPRKSFELWQETVRGPVEAVVGGRHPHRREPARHPARGDPATVRSCRARAARRAGAAGADDRRAQSPRPQHPEPGPRRWWRRARIPRPPSRSSPACSVAASRRWRAPTTRSPT